MLFIQQYKARCLSLCHDPELVRPNESANDL